jgi:hypothetical protein
MFLTMRHAAVACPVYLPDHLRRDDNNTAANARVEKTPHVF